MLSSAGCTIHSPICTTLFESCAGIPSPPGAEYKPCTIARLRSRPNHGIYPLGVECYSLDVTSDWIAGNQQRRRRMAPPSTCNVPSPCCATNPDQFNSVEIEHACTHRPLGPQRLARLIRTANNRGGVLGCLEAACFKKIDHINRRHRINRIPNSSHLLK